MEISVVIVVIMLFAAMVTPDVVAQQDAMRRRQAYGNVFRLVQRARVEAIASGVTHQLTYNEARSRFILERVPDPNQDPEQVATTAIPQGISVDAFRVETNPTPTSEWKVHFYSDGRSEGGAFELDENHAVHGVKIAADGTAKMIDGSVDSSQPESWQAGDYVHR